jgi:hypothetical protein
MLIQGELKWTKVEKSRNGGGKSSSKLITVSLCKSGTKEKRTYQLVIGIPSAIYMSAGFKIGDFIEVKFAAGAGVCQLDRVNDPTVGYKLCANAKKDGTHKQVTKGTLSICPPAEMIKAFMPKGRHFYESPIHETQPNRIQFMIGNAIEKE